MSLLRRLRRPKPLAVIAVELPTGALRRVAGESFHQDVLRRVDAELARPGEPPMPIEVARMENIGEKRWFRAVLIPEPQNPYDPNAIAVWSEVGQIGYLAADAAEDFADVFAILRAQGANAGSCPAHLTGGEPGKPSLGAVLVLSDPHHCLAHLES